MSSAAQNFYSSVDERSRNYSLGDRAALTAETMNLQAEYWSDDFSVAAKGAVLIFYQDQDDRFGGVRSNFPDFDQPPRWQSSRGRPILRRRIRPRASPHASPR